MIISTNHYTTATAGIKPYNNKKEILCEEKEDNELPKWNGKLVYERVKTDKADKWVNQI